MSVGKINPQVTLVIPAYNEYENLEKVVKGCIAFLQGERIAHEIIIVDDGSTDGTGRVAEDLRRKYKEIKVIHHETRKGMSGALKTGFLNASMQCVTFLPADGQISPQELKKLIDSLNGNDLILSYYYKRPDSIFRLVMSKTLRLIIFGILGLAVRLEGVYLFKRTVLDQIKLTCSGSAGLIGFELIYKAKQKGFKTASVEIDCLPRLSGKSKVSNLKTMLITFYELLKIRFNNKSN